MTVVISGTNGITTPDLESSGPITGTTGTFSGNVTLGSSVLATPSGSAPSYTCRAWVNFNGTGTVAIRASGNVSSITDNGTGDYTVNFTTAMQDANYSTNAFGSVSTSAVAIVSGPITSTPSATAFRFKSYNASVVTSDAEFLYVSIFR